MKKLIVILATFLIVENMAAQTKEGKIIYERKVNMHRRMIDEQMKAMTPEFRTASFELLFSDSSSLYKAVVEENAPDPFSPSGGPVLMFRMVGDAGEQYRNYAQSKIVDSRELGAKTYIIEDSLRKRGWKLAEETKNILNYVCKKATSQNERGQQVTAWYTESIPSPAGPENYNGLPGAILQVDINEGEIVFTATSVTTLIDRKLIQEPKKGKKISNADFTKLMNEVMGAPGPDGRRMVTREIN